MAKKGKKRKASTKTRTVYVKTKKRRGGGGRRRGGGTLGRVIGPSEDLHQYGAAFVIGKAVASYKKKDDGLGFKVLDAMPKFVDSAGLMGNLALAATVAEYVHPAAYTKAAKKAAITIAISDYARRGEGYTKATDVAGLDASIEGDDDYDDTAGDFDPSDVVDIVPE